MKSPGFGCPTLQLGSYGVLRTIIAQVLGTVCLDLCLFSTDLCQGPCATVSFHVGLRGSTLRGCINKLMHPLSVCIFNLVTLLKEVDEDWEVVTVAIDE